MNRLEKCKWSPRGSRVFKVYSLGSVSYLPLKMCSVVPNSLWPPWTVARQAPLSVEFSRQEYWSGLPFPPPGDLPNPGIEPASLVSPALAGKLFTTVPPGKCLLKNAYLYANK